jgi:hypothetical protein
MLIKRDGSFVCGISCASWNGKADLPRPFAARLKKRSPNASLMQPDHLSGESRLRLLVPQASRRRRRLRLELRYSRFVFRREIQQPLLGEGVGLPGETAAAFGLFS